MSSSPYFNSKSEFLVQFEIIKDKLRSETSISDEERLIFLTGEILEKVTRKEQGYSHE